MHYINLPGIGGSGERHWQTIWETEETVFSRIAVKDWNAPDLDEWLSSVDEAIEKASGACILVAHSLSCLLAAEYIQQNPKRVKGVFLVAPPDPDSPVFPREEAAEFVTVGQGNLGCPAVVLASQDDPYGDLGYARRRANEWNASLIELGHNGHLNDLGEWTDGRRLLSAFNAGIS